MLNYTFSMQELELFLLFLVRITSFLYAAPFFGMNNIPGQFKIGLGIGLSYILYFATMPHEVLVYSTVLGYATIVMKEVVVGLLLGWAANICSSIVFFAGRMIDMEIGFAMVNAMDPTTRENATISGFYYQYMVMLLLIISGMHRYLIRALAQSFELIPINQAVFNLDKIYNALLNYLGNYVTIGFQICLPIFCAILITNVVLGILAKVSPQMNMFAVGMQIKVLMGLGILMLTTVMLPYVGDFIYKEIKVMVVSIVEAIMP